jgi:hypothetical protein
MAELREDQKLRRLVKVYGIEGLVEVELSKDGISFRVPRTQMRVSMTWPKAVASCDTPGNVPCYLAGNPVETLKHQVVKVQKRAAKKAEAK